MARGVFPLLTFQNFVRNVGVLFYLRFRFTIQVNSVIKSSFATLRDLHHIRSFPSNDVSVMVGNTLVSSRPD